MRRRLLLLESAAAMGGVQFSTIYLAQHLDRSRWDPLVVCPEEGDLSRACRQANVPVVILPLPPARSTSLRFGIDRRLPNPLAWSWNLVVWLMAAKKLAHFLEKEGADLVVTKGLSAHFYGGLAARWAGVPCIWHVQDFISERFWGLYRHFFGLVARFLPDYIIVDGTPIARQFPPSIQERVSVVFNGVDTEVFHPGVDGSAVRRELGIPLDALVIGNVARLTPWKGQHYLLEAFARLVSEFPNVWLLLVGAPVFDGDDYERYLKHRTTQLGVEKRVVFAGFRHDLPQVLAAMDIFAYSAIEKDTSPLALLSAMATGRAIVAFDIEGVREIVRDAGLLVPVGDEYRLTQALYELAVDTGQRMRLGQLSRARATASLGLERHVAAMQEVFWSTIFIR